METLKQKSIKAISKLSEKSNLDDIMYRLYVIGKVKKGKDAVLKAKTISVEDLKKETSKW
jgi:hypothetical protein